MIFFIVSSFTHQNKTISSIFLEDWKKTIHIEKKNFYFAQFVGVLSNQNFFFLEINFRAFHSFRPAITSREVKVKGEEKKISEQ